MRAAWIAPLAAVLGVGLCSCESASRREAGGRLRVFVSIQPQAYFVERVGGPHVEVGVLVPPGQSPHAYEPTPQQVAGLAEAKVYFRIGLAFEDTLLRRIAPMMKGLKVVDTREGITLRKMTEAEGHSEEDGHKGEPAAMHEGEAPGTLDPHTWLSPRLAKVQAHTIGRALAALDPPHAADYERNLKAFEADLDAVDARLAQALAPLKGKEFFVFHPAFGYFADAYGLRQRSVEIEGKSPSARQLGALIDEAKKAGVKVIFVQPQFPRRTAEAVAQAIGGAVVPMDDLPRDYLANLDDMARKIQEALATQK